jgi:TrmH family RNA methyltransferase
MITIRKLKTLKAGTLKRKSAVLLQGFEGELFASGSIDLSYLSELSQLICEVFNNSPVINDKAGSVISLVNSGRRTDTELLLFKINGLRHAILNELGAQPADWDFITEKSPVSRGAEHKAGGMEIYLDDIRSPFNLGSIFRTAEALGVSKILLSPDCPSPDHSRAMRSAMGCTGLVRWERAGKDVLVARNDVFALELGGTAIGDFPFPASGLAVIGSEELGISPDARMAAGRSLGLVSIPVSGVKGSINVSVAFGILMHCWASSLKIG